MLGKGRSCVVNEASNQEANERLTNAVDYMQTKEYQKTRDANDVIPTHKKAEAPKPTDNFKAYNPAQEKADAKEQEDDDQEQDDDLTFLRERRMQAMKKEREKMTEWHAKGHGTYREIAQDDFFGVVVRDKGGSEHVVVHFYHKDFERCKIMDRHLGEVCQEVKSARFVRLDVEKSPFLVDKLKINVLPCLVLFKNDVAVDRVVGFEELGGTDDFENKNLVIRLEQGFRLVEE